MKRRRIHLYICSNYFACWWPSGARVSAKKVKKNVKVWICVISVTDESDMGFKVIIQRNMLSHSNNKIWLHTPIFVDYFPKLAEVPIPTLITCAERRYRYDDHQSFFIQQVIKSLLLFWNFGDADFGKITITYYRQWYISLSTEPVTSFYIYFICKKCFTESSIFEKKIYQSTYTWENNSCLQLISQ